MAYQTGGSGGALTDLMDAIRAFAVSLGWTIDKWDSTNRLLFMTKGLCTVTMKGDTTRTISVYSGANGSGTFASVADHRLYMAMGTSNNAALGTYHSHPGSLVTSDYDGDAVYVNGLNGPYVGWFLFADPSVSDHIHCVVQISAERFMHFSIGHVDKRGMSHSGVAYVHATPNTYYRNVSSWTIGLTSSYNMVDYQNIPFCSGLSNAQHGSGGYDGSPLVILKNSDAWPAAWSGPVTSANAQGLLYGVCQRTLYNSSVYRPEQFPRADADTGCLLDCAVIAEAAPYSNVVPLFPIPVLRYHYDSSVGANSRRLCYVGDFPNVRLCNMSNMIPGQEVTISGDTFKVFPALRQAAWTDRMLVNAPSTGQFALAYKKVA